MTIGPDHASGVGLLGELNGELKPLGFHMRLQQPLTIMPDNEPEPDGAIARGSLRDYSSPSRHPDAAEIACLFEVAASSLKHDRTTKRRIYADAGIAQYGIVNLIDLVVEWHTHPVVGQGRYEDTQTLRSGQTLKISLGTGKSIDVRIDALLP